MNTGLSVQGAAEACSLLCNTRWMKSFYKRYSDFTICQFHLQSWATNRLVFRRPVRAGNIDWTPNSGSWRYYNLRVALHCLYKGKNVESN